LRWFGHVERKDDDWIKYCREISKELNGRRPKKTWLWMTGKVTSLGGSGD